MRSSLSTKGVAGGGAVGAVGGGGVGRVWEAVEEVEEVEEVEAVEAVEAVDGFSPRVGLGAEAAAAPADAVAGGRTAGSDKAPSQRYSS